MWPRIQKEKEKNDHRLAVALYINIQAYNVKTDFELTVLKG